jgi:hypothetical protein
MEKFNELLEFILAHREENYTGAKILENCIQEFDYLSKPSDGLYMGLQLHGKEAIILTFQDIINKYRTVTVISLEDEKND